MLEVLFIVPIVLCIALFWANSRKLNKFALMWFAFVHSIVSIMLFYTGGNFTEFFRADDLSVVFLIVMSAMLVCCVFYALDYLKLSDDKKHTEFSILFLLFVFSMDGAIMSTHIGLLWVFIEATTIASAFLIYFHKSKAALEAAWKYIFICSIGIGIAFIGIIILSISAQESNSLFFADLYNNSATLNVFWLKFSIPFLIIGFGTKMGLAPVHAWLPDAHSEAPSPVSALLSGALLNTALLAILRVHRIFSAVGINSFAEKIYLIMGFLSVFVSAVFILKTDNYKRMLAYSSIENMGIIMIGLGLGGRYAAFTAIFQMIGHSLVKGSLFLTAGNILYLYKTKNINEVKGLIISDKYTGWLWLFGSLAICGFPPFSIFISKLCLIKAMIDMKHFFLLSLFFLLLIIILFGMSSKVFRMAFGTSVTQIKPKFPMRIWSYAPQIALLLISIILGIFMPTRVINGISKALMCF